jgi:cell wall-associated NlpC family hydrolase
VRFLPLLISICCAFALSPVAAMAQDGGASPTAPTQQEGDPNASNAGGAQFGQDPNALPRTYVPGSQAVLLENGLAAAPADAPVQVQEAIFAANELQELPYRYGGGHARFPIDTGYDCSGTVSYALHGGGLLKRPLDSSSFMRWGERGKGAWITVYTNPGHAYVIIAGLRLDTSSAGDRARRGRGPRWRSTARAMRGFRARHPLGF